jgi:hypothetical protein
MSAPCVTQARFSQTILELRAGRIPICAEWRCSCRGEIRVCCVRLPCATSQAGAASAARSLPWGKRQARGRAARTHGWLAATHPRALRVARTALPSRAAIRNDATKLMRPDQQAAPAF